MRALRRYFTYVRLRVKFLSDCRRKGLAPVVVAILNYGRQITNFFRPFVPLVCLHFVLTREYRS